jgi:hypothetical protein
MEKCKGALAPGSSRSKWKDNIKLYLKEIGWNGVEWINMLQDDR